MNEFQQELREAIHWYADGYTLDKPLSAKLESLISQAVPMKALELAAEQTELDDYYGLNKEASFWIDLAEQENE
jgi:hypothetical protein